MAKKFAGALILGLSLSFSAAASPPTSPVLITPPQPAWQSLNNAQKSALAPLAGEWDQMENYRRKKWLSIAERYERMSPAEQQRLQEKMRDWSKLTPDQRLAARENSRNSIRWHRKKNRK